MQITWEKNYKLFSDLIGIDLVAQPDKAMQPDIALFILVRGFRDGIFTGKKLSDFVNDQQTDYVNARRCINGLDKATEIAAIARSNEAAL